MVSIPRASKEIKSPNHFTPGPAVYEWEKCYFIPPKHQNITITSSIREIFPKHEGPGVGQFNVRINPNVHNYYFGYKPDPYSIERKSPGPSDYNPSNQYIITKSPSIRIAERLEKVSQNNENKYLGPAYYNIDPKKEFKSLKFAKSKRLFLDQSLNVPGPQKYKIEAVQENSPRYTFGRERRKLGGDTEIGNPGPGAYNQNLDSQITQRKAIFPKADNDIFKSANTPGPGSYNLSTKITLDRAVKFPKGKRSYDTNKDDNPGPQQYVDISFDTYKQKSTNVIIGTSKKPKDHQDFFQPGPGAYNTHSDQFQNNQHKVFIFGKSKNYLDITADRINVPSPTQYDPKLNQNDGPKIKFTQRLRDFQMNIQNSVPGPGQYLDKERITSKYKFAHSSAQRSPGKYSIKDGIDISVERAKSIPKKRKQMLKDQEESDIDS